MRLSYAAWLAGLACCLASTVLADPAEGLWRTEEGEEGGYLHVSVATCGNDLCGTIHAAFDTDGHPSPDYEHLGEKMIWGMSALGDGAYGGGRIWAPDRDKIYASKMVLNQDQLVVKGCVAGGLVCRGQVWKRVE